MEAARKAKRAANTAAKLAARAKGAKTPSPSVSEPNDDDDDDDVDDDGDDDGDGDKPSKSAAPPLPVGDVLPAGGAVLLARPLMVSHAQGAAAAAPPETSVVVASSKTAPFEASTTASPPRTATEKGLAGSLESLLSSDKSTNIGSKSRRSSSRRSSRSSISISRGGGGIGGDVQPHEKRATSWLNAQVASDRSAKIKELRMLVEMAKAEYADEDNAEEKVELKAKWKARKGKLEKILET